MNWIVVSDNGEFWLYKDTWPVCQLMDGVKLYWNGVLVVFTVDGPRDWHVIPVK